MTTIAIHSFLLMHSEYQKDYLAPLCLLILKSAILDEVKLTVLIMKLKVTSYYITFSVKNSILQKNSINVFTSFLRDHLAISITNNKHENHPNKIV